MDHIKVCQLLKKIMQQLIPIKLSKFKIYFYIQSSTTYIQVEYAMYLWFFPLYLYYLGNHQKYRNI